MTAKTHNLKCWPDYFEEVNAGRKPFEIRKNDRDFQINDYIMLYEWDPRIESYTGQRIEARITYITDFAQQDGYVVMGIHIVRKCRICHGNGKFLGRICEHCNGEGEIK